MIETTEPAEASISARIDELFRQYEQAVHAREKALQLAQEHSDTMLRIDGGIGELRRLMNVIWANAQGEE